MDTIIDWHPNGTPGPWEYIPSNEHHGAYVAAPYAGDVCDFYAMSNPECLSVRNGGISKPIPHQGDRSDTNARAGAEVPAMVQALRDLIEPGMSGKDQLLAIQKARAILARIDGEG